jgi:hypothetical protein
VVTGEKTKAAGGIEVMSEDEKVIEAIINKG